MSTDSTEFPALAAIEAQLLAPGQPFELEDGWALGERMKLFRHRPQSLRDVLARTAEFGESTYMVWADGRRYSYARHLRMVQNLAARLRDVHHVRPGDRVAILAANCPEWVLSFWAITSLGGVAVGLNAWWKGPEIVHGVRDSDPRLLIADPKRLARLDASQRAALGVPVLVIDERFEHGLDEGDAPLPDHRIEEDDAAIMLYTSGTTGRPKAAVHTHRNLGSLLMVSFFHGARLMALREAAKSSDAPADEGPNVVLVTSPLFHVSGLHCAAITALGGGATTVWTMGRFDAEQVLRLIEEERVTGWGYTSTMLHRVVHHPRVGEFDLSSLRMMGGGGSPIAPELQARARELIPNVRETMALGYGLTEACAFTTLNPGPELRAYPESAGRPAPTVQVEIRDDEGNPVPEGTLGDIYVRGPLVMLEYFRNPEATREAIRGGRWLRTGDYGALRGGRLYLASRKRDLILRGGENVYPAPIEQRLEAHPSVAESAVVGIDDDDLGQRVVAFVRLDRPDESHEGSRHEAPDATTLQQWVGDALADFNIPSEIRFVTEPLPRNATGKILKHVLVGEENAFVPEAD